MQAPFFLRAASKAICLTVFLALDSSLSAAIPDFTAAGVIDALKSDPAYSSRPYSETYNLGATGLRGWIYIDGNNTGEYGLITDPSRQILVTVAEAPASAVLAVDDVILGAVAASSGTVPAFTRDCRKAFGVAIGEAEKTGAGTLRVKRWRAGTTTDVNIPMTIMGNYTATAPYSCSKSSTILANARTKLVSQLKADSGFLSNGYGGAIKGLALLAAVAPGDPDYATVQARLKSFATSLAGNGLQPWGMEWWDWSYMSIFLSEYYLRTVADGAPDASVLAGINRYTVAIAKGQSRYGTFSHGGSPLKIDGSLHGTVTPYGPVNAAGIPTNIAIVMGKKALVAGNQAIDPEIDPAIQRGSDFFSYYMNKGSIPYGEHEPWAGGHASNGKDPMCAVLFGLQDNRTAEAEYFARMAVAGCTGREYGHSGQGLSYLWGAMGANMGGSTAVAKYMENFRWHLDLARRTDGSFSYDGQEQYGGGSTAGNTYLGACGYNDISPTATYILSFGVSLQRLYLTGRELNPAHILSADKVTNAIAAATYKLDCPAYTTTQLLADLSAYDPVVRNSAATELSNRTLTTTELNSLIASITNGTLSSDPSRRMGACQALGARKATGALVALGQRLSDSDLWVRGKAAQALRCFNPADSSTQRDTMLAAFAANATDPEVIVWNDPVQIANNFLGFALFGDSVYGAGWSHIAPYTINAPKNLLYPAVKAGLRQPDSNSRLGVIDFANNYLTLADTQALTPDLFAAATTEALADTMWHGEARASAINAVAKFKPVEAISIALSMMDVQPGYGWGAHHFQIAALNVLSSFGDAARWTLPALRQYALTWDTTSSQFATLNNTIASIEAAISSPSGITNFVAVANSQVVVTTGAKAITLTGSSCRGTLTFSSVTAPTHGTLTGTAPNLIYTPAAGYTGPDRFTFKVSDVLTTSETGTVSVIVGTAGTGLKGEYFDNSNFTNLKLTRTDAQINFDWGTGSPTPSIGADTFSVRWSGQLLVSETGSYTFSTLNSDGVRLFINGVPVINDYVDQTTNWKDGTPISLTAGQRVELQMEYYENTGSAVAKLKWTGPSLAGINGSIIAKEWLYDGTGITNRMPYAHAQSLSLIQNVAQAITLTGSGAAQTPLVYSVITQPAHGTLTGDAPNLTYTPAANFSGSDSFTFLVNNGISNSDPATVSIGIWAGTPTSYFWTNAVDGSWSGSFWSNAAGGPVTPAVAGDASYSLNFDKSGTYTTTHDLNNNFAFNQLNLAGNVILAGTNSLSPAANGPALPQINQNSSSAVMISAPVNLAAMTTFGGVGGGSIEMTAVISGAGGVIKDSVGTLQIYGLSPNPYSGGTIVSGGTLHLGAFINGSSPNCVNPVGTGPVTLNSGGTIQFDRVNAGNPLIANGGTLFSANGWGAGWSGAIILNSSVTVNAPYGLTCSGTISGAGGFIKESDGPLVLTGNNSYVGANQITAGTLQCNSASSLGTGPLNISNGAMVALNFTGTRAITALTFNGGAPLAPGTYGSSASPATNKNNTYFSGTGTVTILPASSTALSLTSGSAPSDLGAPLTFTATVTGTVPTGNVAFYDGTALLGTSALNGSFQASLTTNSLAVGSHPITAKYAGNAANAASSSAALAIEVTSLLAAPPTNLFAVRGMNSAGLTWTVSAGATGYHVKRSLTIGGPYTTIGTSVGANYNDRTALNATSYDYVVSATNASGESANSSSVGVMPYVPSSAKDILTFDPAATISGAAINVYVPFGTSVTALAPTYTVSANATGSPASGTTRNFTTPQTYTITAEDGSTKIYTVTVTVMPGSGPPVTSGLVLRMDASQITGTADGGQLDTWTDASSLANNAVRQSGSSSGYPKYVTGALNGNPVVRFNSSNANTGDYFKFTRISTIRSVFWVLKENADLSDGHFLLGDDATYQFHRAGSNGPIWDGGYADSAIKNGTTKLMGNVINGTTTSLPSGSFQLVSLVTTGDVQANQICQDRIYHGSWQGDIAEILIYNRALTGAEELQVGCYLASKYALPTAYPVIIPPVATAQSLNTAEGVALPITLSATGAEGSTLTYAIVTAPANGTLSGTAPNVIYTPNANYTGADSFTFKANDGSLDSAAATVSITVLSSALTWNSAIAGNWSDGTKWVSGFAPANSGLANYILNFNDAGTYTATNDLNSGFRLNQLNFGGSNVTLAGNAIELSANGATMPKINQNSTNSVTISTPISLASNVTLAGTASGLVSLSSLVSGTGSLIKNQAGTLQLYGDSAANTYSGGTIVNSGTLLLGYYNGVSPYCSNPAGTGPITLNTGTTLQFERVGASNALIVNGASSLFTPNGWGVSLSGPITLNATLTTNAPNRLSCSGAISGTGGIIKTSNGELNLSGVNNSTGSTKILAGTMTCSQSAALGTGALEITSGAKLALNFTGTRQIASLALGGSSQPNGSYGSTASSATNKNDTYFTGTGTVTVGPLNTAPVASAQSVSTPEDTAKAITLAATDVNGDALTVAIVATPVHGTLSGSAPNVTYTPAVNYNGSDSFAFKANDGTLDSNVATVTITVTAVNDAPVFIINPIIGAGATESVAYTGQSLAGLATDADAGDTITYSKVSGPAWLAVAADGTLSGTPTAGTAGLNAFVVRVTDRASATADAGLQITVSALPLPWVSADIGTAMLAGSASYNAGTFTLAGSGTLAGTSDKLRFTYQTLTGDGEIIAKISTLQNTGSTARVGVMIRDTLATNSKQIFMGMAGTSAYRWARRTTTGGSITSSSSGTGTVPNTWVRLVRSGTTITAYKSTNGTTWTSVGSTTNTTMAANCYIGLAVDSGSDTTLNTSQFSNLSVTP